MLPLEQFSFRLTKVWISWFVLLGLFISLSLGLVGQAETGPPAHWNNFFLDSFIKNTTNEKVATNAMVVDIDDISLSAAGQWPWPRYRMASLVQTVADNGPAAIGLDILFSEPDRTSLNNIKKSFKQDFDLDISISGAMPGLSDNDGYFGQVLSKTKTVGARYFYFDLTSNEDAPINAEFSFDGKTELLDLHEAPGVLNNTKDIASQLKFSGFVNNQRDNDGMLRKIPLLIKYKGQIYPHLSLATYMRSLGKHTATISQDGNGPIIKIGKHIIPISAQGYAMLRFNGGPQLYPAISAMDIFNGAFKQKQIENKIVFIGSSAAGLNDLHSTIVDSQFPGLKLQAVIIENIINDSFIRIPTWAKPATLFISLIAGLLITVLFIYFRGPLKLFIGTVTVVMVIFTASFLLFQASGLFLSPGTPIIVVTILYIIFNTTRFIIEKKQAYIWYKKLSNARQVTMESMAAVAETRDPETGAHIKRTQYYVKAIAEKLKSDGLYPDILTDDYINLLFVSAPLHDIGKVGVPDHILLKPGKLTEEEFELMKKHAEYGKNIIFSTAQKIEGDNFLIIAAEIASTHHEKWDGTGYPVGLAGQNIPLSGRIMAVADVYDALISKRCYKPPYPHTVAISMMKEEDGKIFDPAILSAFFSIDAEIQVIAAKYRDENEQVLGDR
jgi:HD-GYP domain-containing protein (c-di-GMP phosphodiesterase class II)